MDIQGGDYVEVMTAAAFRAALMEALPAAMEYIHQEIMPRHFAEGADKDYKYKKRKKIYVERKQKRGKGILEWTGETKRQVLGVMKVTESSNTVTGSMEAPWYIGQSKHMRRNRPNMARELLEITNEEQDEIRLVLKEAMEGILGGDADVSGIGLKNSAVVKRQISKKTAHKSTLYKKTKRWFKAHGR